MGRDADLQPIIESYCLRVARFFENGLEGEAWHKELLHRMKLQIGTQRPALLNEDTYLLVDELRSFRHLFRNLYARPLDPERTRRHWRRNDVGTDVAIFRDDQKGRSMAVEPFFTVNPVNFSHELWEQQSMSNSMSRFWS